MPAGIDPQPVVHVIAINTIMAIMVQNIFQPVLSSLLEELEVVVLDIVVVSVLEVEFELEPPLILF